MSMSTEDERPALMMLPHDLQKRVLAHLPWEDLDRAARSCATLRRVGSVLAGRSSWHGSALRGPPSLSSNYDYDESKALGYSKTDGTARSPLPSNTMASAIESLYRAAKPPANPDLTLVFMTREWQENMHDVYAALDRVLPSRAVAIGCGATGVIGTDTTSGETLEFERGSEGIVMACIRVPEGNRVHAFATGCAGIEGSSLNSTLTRIKQGDHRENVAALALADDFDAVVAADGAIKSHFPHAYCIGGLGGSGAHTKPMFVRSCEFQEAREVSGGPKHNCTVGCIIEGSSCTTLPCVTRGVTPLSESCEVMHVVERNVTGMCGPVKEVQRMRVRETDEELTPIDFVSRLSRTPTQVGVRSASNARKNERFRLVRPTYADGASGALAFDRDLHIDLTHGAELCCFAITPESSDAELYSVCCEQTEECSQGALPDRTVLGMFVFACAGRGQEWRSKADGGASPDETKAAREAVDAPLIGMFCNGEFGPRPAREQGGSQKGNVSFPMGFTGVYGVLSSPALWKQTDMQ